MADSVEVRMSVNAIKRVDPYVKDILTKSTHVALYKFNASSNEWEKTETEGALFLCSRNGEPFHSLMIMNRLNTTNLLEPIIKEFEYQMQAPFLLYRNSKNKIFGIWFYNREECVNITLILETVMESFKEKNTDKSKQKENVDIFRLLTAAQENFNKTPNKNSDNQQPQFSTPHAPDVTSQSVMDFFAKAGSKAVPKPVHNPGEGEIHFTLQRLMSNPAHSVEHIEKQQRSTTPQEQIIMRQPKLSTNSDRRSVPMKTENGINFIRVASPQQNIAASQSPLANFLATTNMHAPVEDRASPLAQLLDTPQKPALMPPMMFASSTSQETSCHSIQNILHNNSSNNYNNIEPLTKNQMLQALTYLLKHDSDFITKLHEAYVKSLSEMVNHSSSLI